MIVVTTGTNEQPFDRLVGAAASLSGDEPRLVQFGSSTAPHGAGRWVDFLPFEELKAAMLEARVVISHAGVGSIMLARRCGKTPIVMPRRGHLGEAVDDHQHRLASRLAAIGVVVLAEHSTQLDELLAAPAPAAAGSGALESGSLAAELEHFFARRALRTTPLAGGNGSAGRSPLLCGAASTGSPTT